MFSRNRCIFVTYILAIMLSFLLSCGTSGISVKELEEPSDYITGLSELQQKALEAEIIVMSRVTQNSVFTEEMGVPEYIIGPGDVLIINHWVPYTITIGTADRPFEEGFKHSAYTVTVRPDGKISYMLGDDILVSGYTAQEVDDILTNELKKYIKHPRLEVVVKEYKSKSALLFGQINILQVGTSGPGKYNLTGKTTILDLIVRAGGAISGQNTGNADLKRVEMVRKGKRYTLNLYNAMFRGDMSQNIIIDDGDVVTVPELPTFGESVYVVGEVNSQGIYRLKDADNVLAAVAIAGGTTSVAVDSDLKIIREYKERKGKPIILSVNLDEILKKGDLPQNITLQNGDVVYVPRTKIGDINEFIRNTTPLLDYLLYPGSYRDTYWKDPANKLRF